MTMDPIRDIPVGAEIYTEDNDKIGTVKEVTATAFKVDAPLQPDYWLTRSAVLAYTAERVTLTVPKDKVDEHKVSPDGTA